MMMILLGLIGIALGLMRIAEGLDDYVYRKRKRRYKRKKYENEYRRENDYK